MASDMKIEAESAARLVADAGGEIVGRTKLQKIAFMLEVMDLGAGFDFEYKHYGPYSERLTSALKAADLFDLIGEETRSASWGGFYSIFRSKNFKDKSADENRRAAVSLGNASDPVELELAATAVLLQREGLKDPWKETELRKPDKAAGGRLEKAQILLKKFRELQHGDRIPAIA